MADEVDKANEYAEVFLDVALKNHKHKPIPAGVGICMNCGVPVEGDARWCGVECRDDWEANAKRHG
jgi:predicted nucleic acid-binding Zn ribbon protein